MNRKLKIVEEYGTSDGNIVRKYEDGHYYTNNTRLPDTLAELDTKGYNIPAVVRENIAERERLTKLAHSKIMLEDIPSSNYMIQQPSLSELLPKGNRKETKRRGIVEREV